MFSLKGYGKFFGLVLAALFLFSSLYLPTVMAAPLDPVVGAAVRQPVQIIWQKTKLGKLSGDLLLIPNHNLLLPLGKKALMLNLEGQTVWEWTGSTRGVTGNPIFTENGILFMPGSFSFQELKPNGVAGWNFSIYSSAKGDKQTGLTGGAGAFLYLPLPDGLYAVDQSGRYTWRFAPWEVKDLDLSKTPKKQWSCLASAADAEVVYVVHGAKKEGFRLTAIRNDGKYIGSYWLGDIHQADLLLSPDGRLYLTVKPKKANATNNSAIYPFMGSICHPEWSFTLNQDALSPPTRSADDTLYFIAGSRLYALDAKTGAYKWDNPLYKLASLPPTVDPRTGRIYVGNSEGYLYALNREGRLDWSYKLDGTFQGAPLIGPDGCIYVATQKGSLYKLKDNAVPIN